MTVKVAINGLGRIGRCVIRALVESGRNDIEIVAVNGPAPVETHVHLLKYDSIHGHFRGDVKAVDGGIDVGRGVMKLTHERDLSKLDWSGIDIVMECSGKFTKRADAAQHLARGAKKVLVSAPSPDADATIVYGVNNAVLKPEHQVVSIGSCTTNCLAPVAKVLNDTVGIEHGFMTTIHSYTGDQNIVDGSHKDLRRARAAAQSIIPTSTGAAKAIGLVLPELDGKLGGTAVRVPTPNVSLVDLTFQAGRDTNKDELNAAIAEAAQGALKGVLAISSEPLVSIDFNHHPASSIFDTTGTSVTGKRFCRVVSWYDNEWGFSCRMLDMAKLVAGC
ncbi:MAG TPA: type I glyceraldehyde-3-phosphate dehydrogenase [Rickettsiales bacterium]|nr:type I glyceraldehyde-3-phosphate dehydrogenase [Rickettsiales bacterium]